MLMWARQNNEVQLGLMESYLGPCIIMETIILPLRSKILRLRP